MTREKIAALMYSGGEEVDCGDRVREVPKLPHEGMNELCTVQGGKS